MLLSGRATSRNPTSLPRLEAGCKPLPQPEGAPNRASTSQHFILVRYCAYLHRFLGAGQGGIRAKEGAPSLALGAGATSQSSSGLSVWQCERERRSPGRAQREGGPILLVSVQVSDSKHKQLARLYKAKEGGKERDSRARTARSANLPWKGSRLPGEAGFVSVFLYFRAHKDDGARYKGESRGNPGGVEGKSALQTRRAREKSFARPNFRTWGSSRGVAGKIVTETRRARPKTASRGVLGQTRGVVGQNRAFSGARARCAKERVL